MHTDLTKADSHFAFGENWSAYAELIDGQRVAAAEADLARLLGSHDLSGKRFLDIGSGSGLHSLAALRLGAQSVLAIDLDADSVATTSAVLSRFAPSSLWSARKASVFDLRPTDVGDFDIVYSWGVLHHTGDLDRALSCAAALVAPKGIFAVALYRRVWMDWFWKTEKRWYAFASPKSQSWARRIYTAAFSSALLARGSGIRSYRKSYFENRGMSFEHDIHDWLGGWPYESISAGELDTQMFAKGFRPRCPPSAGISSVRRANRRIGLFGSGCDEYLYERAD